MLSPLDHLTLRGSPGAVALHGKFGTIDYAALEAMTGRLALWLKHGPVGRKPAPGSRITAWLPKGIVSALLPLAVARAGHVYVPINPLLKRAQVAHILADSGAAMLISQSARLATLEQADKGEAVALIEDAAIMAVMQDASGPALAPSSADLDALVEILYTSGSTGRPKGVMLSHANLMTGARSVASYLGLTADDRVMAILPLSFDYGQNQLLSTWWAGGCVTPLDYLLPRDVAKTAGLHRITTLAGVPSLWAQLTEIEWPEDALASLRRITNSGGALTLPLVERLRATFPGVDIFAMYGLTEAFRSTFLPPRLLADHPQSIGHAIPDAEVLVVRPDGSIAADDEPGELVHCGPLVAQGYWRDPTRTEERFRPAPAASAYGGMAVWSGDTVARDRDGLLRFIGREDAMIKRAGNRISPTEIEEAVMGIAGVAEACALGVADERLGQAILLYVRGEVALCERDRDALPERIGAQLRRDLPNFMQPSEIRLVAEMPRNPNGKIDRMALAAIAQQPAS